MAPILLILSQLLSSVQPTEGVFPLVISAADYRCIEVDSVVTWMSRAIPPSIGHRVSSYTFQIRLSVVVADAIFWRDPTFAVEYSAPDGTSDRFLVDVDSLRTRSGIGFPITFVTKTSRLGRLVVQLIDPGELDRTPMERSARLVSNKKRVELRCQQFQ